MITVRSLTKEEQEALAQRLEALIKPFRALTTKEHIKILEGSLANLPKTEAYDYVMYGKELEYTISSLKDYDPMSVVEEEEGRAIRYSVEFASHRATWARRCGRAGACILDADSLRLIHCRIVSMN